jgi:hypothetical protein
MTSKTALAVFNIGFLGLTGAVLLLAILDPGIAFRVWRSFDSRYASLEREIKGFPFYGQMMQEGLTPGGRLLQVGDKCNLPIGSQLVEQERIENSVIVEYTAPPDLRADIFNDYCPDGSKVYVAEVSWDGIISWNEYYENEAARARLMNEHLTKK